MNAWSLLLPIFFAAWMAVPAAAYCLVRQSIKGQTTEPDRSQTVNVRIIRVGRDEREDMPCEIEAAFQSWEHMESHLLN
jgi:hypothetical protein